MDYYISPMDCQEFSPKEVESLEKVKESFESMLDKFQKSLNRDELNHLEREVKAFRFLSQEMIVLLRVMIKIRTELAYANLELQKATKTNKNMDECKKRVFWLEKRLHRVLLKSKSLGISLRDNELDNEVNNDDNEASSFEKEFFNLHLSPEYRNARKALPKGRAVVAAEHFDVATKAKKLVEREVEKSIESADACVENVRNEEKGAAIGSLKEVESPTHVLIAEADTADAVEDYWYSDHHRIEENYRHSDADPLSWHSLPISYHDTFLFPVDKEDHPVVDVPLSEQSSVGDIVEFQKKSFGKLIRKIEAMYLAFDDAANEFVAKKNERRKRIVLRRKDTVSLESAAVDVCELPKMPHRLAPKGTLLPSVTSSVTATKAAEEIYPRSPQVWCEAQIPVQSFVHGKELRASKKVLGMLPSRKVELIESQDVRDKRKLLRNTIQKARAVAKFRIARKRSSPMSRTDRGKWNRIVEMLGPSGIDSNNDEIAVDAIKCIAQFGCTESVVTQALSDKVENTKSCVVAYEASKALLSLGEWHPVAIGHLRRILEQGNEELKLNVLKIILEARDARFVNRRNSDIIKLGENLLALVKGKDENLAFYASLCLGHLCIVYKSVENYLIGRLEDKCFNVRSMVLEALVRQMNCKEKQVIEVLLHQIRHANKFKHRVKAADLLICIGQGPLFTLYEVDDLFYLLEELLWNDPSKEVRLRVAAVLDVLGLKQRARKLVTKRLEDVNENARAHGLAAMAALGIRRKGQLRSLLDMLELDYSIQVRIEVIRAFALLNWTDKRVICALEEKKKGSGPIAYEAKKALKTLRAGIKEST